MENHNKISENSHLKKTQSFITLAFEKKNLRLLF